MLLLLISILAGLISGVSVAMALPPFEQSYTLLFAFIPAFYLLDRLTVSSRLQSTIIWITYCLTFIFTWTSISFHWLYEISWGTFTLAVTFAAILLIIFTILIIFISSAFLRKTAFVILFVLYEVWSFHSEISTLYSTIGPWLTAHPIFIQYYSFLGISSGTFWLLITNLFLYEVLLNRANTNKKYTAWLLVVTLLFPLCSIILFFTKEEQKHHLTIALANTKIDPFNSTLGADESKVRQYIHEQFSAIEAKQSIDLLIYPEGVTNHLGWIGNEMNEKHIQALNNLRKEQGVRSMLIGGLMYQQVFSPDEHYSVQEKDGYYYTTHNVSLQLRDEGVFVQSKEYFVPFQEYIPYPELFMRISQKIKNVGYNRKISPLASTQPHIGNFTTLICYEALKPCSRIQSQNDDFIVVVASESWTKSEAAHQQFNLMLKAIALKNNKTIVKSSNYGTSLIVNNLGQVKQSFSNEKIQLINI